MPGMVTQIGHLRATWLGVPLSIAIHPSIYLSIHAHRTGGRGREKERIPDEECALIDRDMDIEGMGKLRVRARFRAKRAQRTRF